MREGGGGRYNREKSREGHSRTNGKRFQNRGGNRGNQQVAKDPLKGKSQGGGGKGRGSEVNSSGKKGVRASTGEVDVKDGFRAAYEISHIPAGKEGEKEETIML